MISDCILGMAQYGQSLGWIWVVSQWLCGSQHFPQMQLHGSCRAEGLQQMFPLVLGLWLCPREARLVLLLLLARRD